jgi:hypothetical protein
MNLFTIFLVPHRLFLWMFRRKEWVKSDERKIGSWRMAFDRPDSPVYDLIEITWRHPCGYTMRNRWLR